MNNITSEEKARDLKELKDLYAKLKLNKKNFQKAFKKSSKKNFKETEAETKKLKEHQGIWEVEDKEWIQREFEISEKYKFKQDKKSLKKPKDKEDLKIFNKIEEIRIIMSHITHKNLLIEVTKEDKKRKEEARS